jgi:hypothetical protein
LLPPPISPIAKARSASKSDASWNSGELVGSLIALPSMVSVCIDGASAGSRLRLSPASIVDSAHDEELATGHLVDRGHACRVDLVLGALNAPAVRLEPEAAEIHLNDLGGLVGIVGGLPDDASNVHGYLARAQCAISPILASNDRITRLTRAPTLFHVCPCDSARGVGETFGGPGGRHGAPARMGGQGKGRYPSATPD